MASLINPMTSDDLPHQVRTSVPSYKAGQVSLVGLVTRFRHGCPPLIAVPFRARESLTSTADH